ncbi:MAG: N-acetylglucosamine-6-phosphate deacetylase [Chitinophagaceae bacterium]|nr:N-acetylglucosamine-6-phosphate deacetylase [Anaerolineae bacterium]
MSILFTNAKVILPTKVLSGGWLLCEEKSIRLIGSGDTPKLAVDEVINAEGRMLIPGFIDVHVHGAMGYDTMDANSDALLKMAQFYAQHGVTGFLPTTWTQPRDRIMAALEVIAANKGQQSEGATILGAHLEGPYINAEKRGAQREQDVRRADRDEALSFLNLNVIRLLALAPEFEENKWLIQECVKRGVTVSVAHTNANYQQVVDAAALGLSHATHTYNAMTGLNHRDPGTLGAVMTLPQITCELIADNIHVHPAAMQILYAAKGAHRLVLITDSVRTAGLPEGEYAIDDRSVFVKDGAVRLSDGTLAGSMLTMDVGVKNFMVATGQSLENIWQTTSLNAARSIGLAAHKGSLEVGKDADLVLVDDDVHVYMTVAEGRIVYRNL